METVIKYILLGFGYRSMQDFSGTLFKGEVFDKATVISLLSIAGALTLEFTGMQLSVAIAFAFLVVAEAWTGIKVSMKVKGENFKSRKFGRMILKVGTYITILGLINVFASQIDIPDLFGLSMNPFRWLYYTVFIAIVFQLFISWMENLGCLGYKETKSIAGFVLRKFNQWFEFDGTKDNGQE